MCKILIVDDEPTILDLFSIALKKDNTVKTAASAIEAQACLNTFTPDIVLLDIYLGEDRGDELVKTGWFGEATILMMTCADISNDRQAEMLRNGVFDVIHKEKGTSLLIEKVKMAFTYRDALSRASQGLSKHSTAIINLEEAGEHFRRAHTVLREMTTRVKVSG